jgi:hypothetical protein
VNQSYQLSFLPYSYIFFAPQQSPAAVMKKRHGHPARQITRKMRVAHQTLEHNLIQ